MPTELSKSQIDKLGKRLRDTDVLDTETITALKQVRDRYEAAMTEVADTLHQVFDRRPAGRVKTLDTLTQKLRRQRIKLSSVQDVAGVRMVLRATRQGQDQAVTRVVEPSGRNRRCRQRTLGDLMKHFLLVYHRPTGSLVELREFSDSEHTVALHELSTREAQELDDPDVEVVLLTSDSVGTLRVTHARYFMSASR